MGSSRLGREWAAALRGELRGGARVFARGFIVGFLVAALATCLFVLATATDERGSQSRSDLMIASVVLGAVCGAGGGALTGSGALLWRMVGPALGAPIAVFVGLVYWGSPLVGDAALSVLPSGGGSGGHGSVILVVPVLLAGAAAALALLLASALIALIVTSPLLLHAAWRRLRKRAADLTLVDDAPRG